MLAETERGRRKSARTKSKAQTLQTTTKGKNKIKKALLVGNWKGVGQGVTTAVSMGKKIMSENAELQGQVEFVTTPSVEVTMVIHPDTQSPADFSGKVSKCAKNAKVTDFSSFLSRSQHASNGFRGFCTSIRRVKSNR